MDDPSCYQLCVRWLARISIFALLTRSISTLFVRQLPPYGVAYTAASAVSLSRYAGQCTTSYHGICISSDFRIEAFARRTKYRWYGGEL
jgi:hypothetical protein